MKSLARISRALVHEFRLDLSHHTVLTEAATGPFAATAAMAAFSGAKVYAIAKPSPFGSRRNATTHTLRLAQGLGVADRIHVFPSIEKVPLGNVDIITNSGHVRPISAKWIRKVSSHAVVSLMMEPWEVRPSDVDLRALQNRSIPFAGVNERGRKVNVFSYLVPLLAREIRKGDRVFLRSAPAFSPYLRRAISLARAKQARRISEANVFVIAVGPTDRITKRELHPFPAGKKVIQLWGDIEGTRAPQWRWIPTISPRKGHMGLRLDDLGPEPAIRLAAAGLKVGELLSKARAKGLSPQHCVAVAAHSGFAMPSRR